MESAIGGNLNLEVFQVFILKFNYFSAFCADHVIMVLSQVAVFISELPVIEPISLSKPVAAHELQRVSYKIAGVIIAGVIKDLDQFSGGDMLLFLEECFQDVVSVFKSIDLFLVEKLFELFLFLPVQRFHAV